MDFFFLNIKYFYLTVFILIAFFIFFILFLLSFILIQEDTDLEKLSAYECGFDPFEESLGRFDIKFYLVAILFLVFDLEIVYLFPWSVVVFNLDIFYNIIILIFVFILFIGFAYEWVKGALDWN
jgi:NADH-quinone oxidoreductase subunit A